MDHSRKIDAQYETFFPPLAEIVTALSKGLESNFSDVEVSEVGCPDLSLPPFNLAAPGICGRERIVDVGGPGNLFPHIIKEKRFDIKSVCDAVGLPDGFAIGPGAGPFHKVGVNSEMMANCNCCGENRSLVAKINPETDSYVQESAPEGTTEFCLMANLLVSEGKQGQVIRVRAKRRTGSENFVTCMRNTLRETFGEKAVAMGGVFVIKTGKAKLHVMPDFPVGGFRDNNHIENDWLKYFEMSAPLVCLSVFHSVDPGYDLRVEHTHCFSEHGDGGHYHYDVTPDTVEYEGYFSLAHTVYRIDQVSLGH